jgi:hypothetical protein
VNEYNEAMLPVSRFANREPAAAVRQRVKAIKAEPAQRTSAARQSWQSNEGGETLNPSREA